MNFKKLILIISIFFLSACNQFDQNNKNLVYISDQKYSNTGFALIYDDELKKEKKITKKIDNRSLLIFHNKIKKNSFVKITNPINDKSIIAEVISNNVKFSSFYNSVITQRIAAELSLDPKEPYIDLVLISKNSTFVAKKAKTFDEEKSVAEKAPVDGITIDNLGKDKDIIPDAETLNPAYIVFDNYEIILKWNRSLRFALAVCTLKDKFKNEL